MNFGLNLIKEWLDSENLSWWIRHGTDNVIAVNFEGIGFLIRISNTNCLEISPANCWPGYKGTGRIELSNPACFDFTYQYMVKWLTDHLKSTEGMVDHRSIYQET